jgi:hypothetical protein
LRIPNYILGHQALEIDVSIISRGRRKKPNSEFSEYVEVTGGDGWNSYY